AGDVGPQIDPSRQVNRTEASFAACVVVLGLLLLAGVRGIAPGGGYDRVGPRFFPVVTATGMILLGAVLGISAWRQRPPVESTPVTPLTWMPFVYFALAFLLFIALLEP